MCHQNESLCSCEQGICAKTSDENLLKVEVCRFTRSTILYYYKYINFDVIDQILIKYSTLSAAEE